MTRQEIIENKRLNMIEQANKLERLEEEMEEAKRELEKAKREYEITLWGKSNR